MEALATNDSSWPGPAARRGAIGSHRATYGGCLLPRPADLTAWLTGRPTRVDGRSAADQAAGLIRAIYRVREGWLAIRDLLSRAPAREQDEVIGRAARPEAASLRRIGWPRARPTGRWSGGNCSPGTRVFLANPHGSLPRCNPTWRCAGLPDRRL